MIAHGKEGEADENAMAAEWPRCRGRRDVPPRPREGPRRRDRVRASVAAYGRQTRAVLDETGPRP